jgi:hypothetical protein
MNSKIEIPLNKKKVILALIGAMFFVGMGLLGALNPENFVSPVFRNPGVIRIIGVVGVVFFGISLFFIVPKLLEDKQGLTIDSNGIINNSNGINVGLIEWRDVTGIETIEVVSTKFLIVHIINPEEYIEREKKGILKKAMKANQKMYGSPISITSSSLKMNFKELEALIIQEYKRNRKNIL